MKTLRRTMKAKPKVKKRAAARIKKPDRSGESRSGKVGPKPVSSNVHASLKRLSKEGSKNDMTSSHAISAVKLMSVMLHLREVNNHLQGLYAEVGKIVYDQQISRPLTSKLPLPHLKELFHKISPLRKKMERLERESKALKRTA